MWRRRKSGPLFINSIGWERGADDFSVYNQLDLIKLQKETARSLTLLIGSVAALAWMVGGVGILAVMLMSVRERRPEIGLRRALGARAGDVRYQFCVRGRFVGFGGRFERSRRGSAGRLDDPPDRLGAGAGTLDRCDGRFGCIRSSGSFVRRLSGAESVAIKPGGGTQSVLRP